MASNNQEGKNMGGKKEKKKDHLRNEKHREDECGRYVYFVLFIPLLREKWAVSKSQTHAQ